MKAIDWELLKLGVPLFLESIVTSVYYVFKVLLGPHDRLTWVCEVQCFFMPRIHCIFILESSRGRLVEQTWVRH
jgi:hypothetical protein